MYNYAIETYDYWFGKHTRNHQKHQQQWQYGEEDACCEWDQQDPFFLYNKWIYNAIHIIQIKLPIPNNKAGAAAVPAAQAA